MTCVSITWRKRFARVYSHADWFAHLLLSTCIVAAWNFLDVLSLMFERAAAAAEAARHGFTMCFFGPPAPFYPRFFALVALLVATPYSFKKTAGSRLVASIGSAVAFAAYGFWWVDSHLVFYNFEHFGGVPVLDHPHIQQFAYLYQGTPPDLAVALSTAVCLVLTLDRLFDVP
jgi:hypothetical protein